MPNSNLPLAINQVTTRNQWNFAESVDGYARYGIRGISVWADKLRHHGVKAAVKLLNDTQMSVCGLCVGGLLTEPEPAKARQQIDENRRLLDDAAAVGSTCLVLIGGGLAPGERALDDARKRVLERIAELLPHAREVGVTLALEPLHPMVCAFRSVLCTLGQANDWYEQLGGGAGLGIAVDTYNVWWDPHLEREIQRAAGRIAAYHVSDWLLETNDLRTDRGMPGDGVIDLKRLRQWVQAAGYEGFQEVEILSTRWWQSDPEFVVQQIVARYDEMM